MSLPTLFQLIPKIYAAEPELTASFSRELRELWVSIGLSTFILIAFIAFLISILIYHGFFSKNKFLSIAILVGLSGSLLITLGSLNEKRTTISQASVAIVPRNVKVESVTGDSAVISWLTTEPTTGFVKYGVLPDRLEFLGLDIRKNVSVRNHKVLLTNLEPGVVYYYMIVSDGIAFDKDGKPLMFTTLSQ